MNQLSNNQTKHNNDPLHGITLEAILTALVIKYGWEELGGKINIACFNSDPSIKSSLKFLRKTPWARTKVENLYLKANKSVSRPQKLAQTASASSDSINQQVWGDLKK